MLRNGYIPLFVALLTSIADAQFRLDPVAMSGQQAPDMPAGRRFSNLFGIARMNDSGCVAFLNGSGVWAGPPGGIRLLAGPGLAAPGTEAGTTFSNVMEHPYVNSAGGVAFGAGLSGPSVTTANNIGVFLSNSSGMDLVCRKGMQVPGATSGAVFSGFNGDVRSTPGQAVFMATLWGDGVNASNNTGIWAGSGAGMTAVARTGSQAPGTTAGTTFSGLTMPQVTAGGQILLNATMVGAEVNSTNARGLWTGSAGNLNLIVRDGDQAPGLAGGVKLLDVAKYGCSNLSRRGELAFSSYLQGPGIVNNNEGLWSGMPGSYRLVAQKGDLAPGAVESWQYFDHFKGVSLNSSGEMAFSAQMHTGEGIWTDRGDGLEVLACSNMAAPGAPGLYFKGMNQPMINERGQVIFAGEVGTYGGGTVQNRNGVWATDLSGVLRLLVRVGDAVQVAPGDTRIVSSITLGSITDGISADPQVAMQLNFNDNSAGIFIATIPEPATLTLLGLGGLVMVRRRH
jgi:hypothetical protein